LLPALTTIGLVAGLLVAAPAASAAPALTPAAKPAKPAAGSVTSDPKLQALMRHQNALSTLAKAVIDQAMHVPNSGYVSISFEGDGLGIYWKGGVPAAMQPSLDAIRKVAPLVIHPAAYSQAELRAQAAKLDKAAKGSDIQRIVLRHDGSGIIVEKQPASVATASSTMALAGSGTASPSTARRIPAESAVAAARVSVPVTVSVATSSISTGSSRLADNAPWNAGGYMKFDLNNPQGAHYCTTGFAVWLNGQTYILTAWHCTVNASQYVDYNGIYMGTPGPQWDPSHDLALVNARGWYWMFDGNVPYMELGGHLLDNSASHKTVHSWDYAIGNESVCQSGVTSGTRCWLLTNPNMTFSYYLDNGQPVYDLSQACRTQGNSPAGQHGDSGGPVFTLDGDGVRAKGVFSGFDDAGNCILFQDMRYVTWAHGNWPGVTPRTA
jgi:hypothetical protein